VIHGRRFAGLLLVVPVAALALAACGPTPAPAPPPHVPCYDVGTAGATIAACHLNYATYTIDPNPFAQQVADSIAVLHTCANLGAHHTASSTLHAVYPAATSIGENLYCQWSSSGACPSNGDGATNAINAWLNSPPHRANMDGFVGASVVGGASCSAGYYIAVAQFHRP